jgi:hypothetical protein
MFHSMLWIVVVSDRLLISSIMLHATATHAISSGGEPTLTAQPSSYMGNAKEHAVHKPIRHVVKRVSLQFVIVIIYSNHISNISRLPASIIILEYEQVMNESNEAKSKGLTRSPRTQHEAAKKAKTNKPESQRSEEKKA